MNSRFLLAIAAAVGITVAAQAATYTWDGTANENWGTAHWTGAGASWVNNNGNDAVINGGIVYVGSNGGSDPRPGSVTANSITVGNATLYLTSNNAFWSTVGTITLNAGGVLNSGWNATSHLNAGIVLNGGDITGSDNSGGAATWGIYNLENTIHVTADSTISVTGAGATLGQTGGTQFNVDSGKTLSVTGTFVHNVNNNDYGLIKNGDGTMTLTNINTYTAGTTVNGGVLEVSGQNGGTGGIRGIVTVNTGGELRATGPNGAVFGYTTNAKIDTFNIAGGTVNTSVGNNHIWGAAVNMTGGTLKMDSNPSNSTTGNYYEWGNSTVNTFASTSNSTISGRIRIRADVNPMLTFTVADGATATDLLVNAAITESNGASGITKSGAGTMVLAGTNTYTGTTTVSAGTLKLDFSAFGAPQTNIVNNSANSSALSFSGGKLLVSGKDGTTNSQNFNGVSASVAGQILFTSGASGTLNASLGSITRPMPGLSTLDIVLPATGTISATIPGNNGTVIVDANGNWANFVTVNNGATWASLSGNNIVPFTSYSVNTFGNFQTHTDLTLDTTTGVATTGDIRFNVDGKTLTLTGALNVDAGGILVTSNAAPTGVTITGSSLYGNGGAKKLGIFNYGKLTIASQITDTINGVVFAGTGTTTLTAANTYIGNTLITGGKVALGNALALQNSAFNTASVNGGLDVTGYSTLTLGGLTGSVNLSPTLIVGYGSVTGLILNPQSGTQTYSGVISNGSGAMSLTKTGAGTMVLSNAGNNYTGGTTINQGTLTIDVQGSQTASALGVNKAVVVSSGATLRLNKADALGYYGANPSSLNISGTMTIPAGNLHATVGAFGITLNGGTITSEGSGDGMGNYIFDGTITTLPNVNASVISAHTIKLRNGSGDVPNQSVTFTVADGAAATDLSVSSILDNGSGANGVTKSGAGTMVLSGMNIYTGATAVNGGTLVVSGSISSSAGTTVNAGALIVNGTLTGAVSVASGAMLGGTNTIAGALTLASGALLSPGAATNLIGTLTLSGTAPALSGRGLVADVSATSGVCDTLALSGSIDLSGLTVTVRIPGTLPSANTYVLLSSTGALSGRPTLAGDLSSTWYLSVKNGNTLVLMKNGGTMIRIF
jgi:autotransporter-associated beta strand protein